MRALAIAFLFSCLVAPMRAQEPAEGGPTNEKAQKTYREGLEYLHRHMTEAAVDAFKKADKQDGGHCLGCQRRVIKYAVEIHDWKAAESAAAELLGEAGTPKEQARAHDRLGGVLVKEGLDKHKDELFQRAHQEFAAALAAEPKFANAIFGDGLALAHLKQDDAARARFEEFANLKTEDDLDRQRALRYLAEPDLARARMAPPFSVTTVDGQRISLDDLEGKVVLIDFWATWCGPCRAALPHVQEIARKFQGQPLIVLSVSVDHDERAWKEFIGKNEMTWPQYYDGGFTGPIAKLFGVQAIPHTFTIDADGVLQDEHIGDASIEGKLKKLVKRAQDIPPRPKTASKEEGTEPTVQ